MYSAPCQFPWGPQHLDELLTSTTVLRVGALVRFRRERLYALEKVVQVLSRGDVSGLNRLTPLFLCDLTPFFSRRLVSTSAASLKKRISDRHPLLADCIREAQSESNFVFLPLSSTVDTHTLRTVIHGCGGNVKGESAVQLLAVAGTDRHLTSTSSVHELAGDGASQ